MKGPVVFAVVLLAALAVVPTAQRNGAPIVPPVMSVPAGSSAVEQTTEGTRAAAALVETFDGLGAGFEGPQGAFRGGNPSDNSLAVGPEVRRGRVLEPTGPGRPARFGGALVSAAGSAGG